MTTAPQRKASMPGDSLPEDSLIGRVIAGKFAIESRLGAGAMGTVYRAWQTALERTVAVKVLRGAFAADPTFAARFHLEARAASRLDHPNLTRVLDYGREPDGLLYIAMEFLDGRDLFEIIEDDWPLSHERIVDLLSQTLSGLAEAHEGGVLHRDVKPENILVLRRAGEDGAPVDQVKVCDFGIAKIVEAGGQAERGQNQGESGGAGRRLTTAGLVVGTPEYMSPEQARGEAFDARSDVYAVGVILYQLLTRRLPFQAPTAIEVVWKAMNEEAPSPDAAGPTCAPGLDAICVRAMRKQPGERFPSAREMRAALRAAPPAAGQSVIDPAARPSVPAPAPKGRWRVYGALVAASIAVAAAAVSLRRESSSAAPPVGESPAPTPAALRVAPAEEREAPSPTAPASTVAPVVARLAAAPGARRLPGRPSADVSPPISTDAASGPGPDDAPVTSATPSAVPGPPPVLPIEPRAPVSSSAPSAAPAGAPATPAPPRANPETARVTLGLVKSRSGGGTSSSVKRGLAPLTGRFSACYRDALALAGGVAGEEDAMLHLESDDQGYVTTAQVVGAVPASAARCIEGVSRSARIEVDTGTASADVTLSFTAR